MRSSFAARLGLALLAAGRAAALHAQEEVPPPPFFLGAQATLIGQHLSPFSSPYSGPHSFTGSGDAQLSQSYGLYLGYGVTKRLQFYLDIEMVRGGGIGQVVGLGGPTNGDVLRQGSADLGEDPYVARAFVRYLVPLGGSALDTIARAQDLVPLVVPSARLELTAGRLALSDVIDLNRYANSTRVQFMDWGLFNNTAWDFAADTRGYTNGFVIAWLHPIWALRLGVFMMPTYANGNVLDTDIRQAHGDNLELTVTPNGGWIVMRFLAYVNHARMGRYSVAIDSAESSGMPPNIVADDAPGRRKTGFGLNAELPLADGGATGLFLRAGWNDGTRESFAYAESDASLSAGLQASGLRWGRPLDVAGVALMGNGLSGVHREYLALGGLGFMLGDGRLSYAPEGVVEAYYLLQLGTLVQVSPDLQFIANPGYNRDRGPAFVQSLRLRVAY